MLTAEDLEAQDQLIAALTDMTLEEVVEAYREARRRYEARHWASEDADEAEVHCEILARELADRLAFGQERATPTKADHEGETL